MGPRCQEAIQILAFKHLSENEPSQLSNVNLASLRANLCDSSCNTSRDELMAFLLANLPSTQAA